VWALPTGVDCDDPVAQVIGQDGLGAALLAYGVVPANLQRTKTEIALLA
jgi:hypothetical protein